MILISWSTENNRMKFNKDSVKYCSSEKETNCSYKMEDTSFCNTTIEKDLGIVVDHKLNISQQYGVGTKKDKCYFRLH